MIRNLLSTCCDLSLVVHDFSTVSGDSQEFMYQHSIISDPTEKCTEMYMTQVFDSFHTGKKMYPEPTELHTNSCNQMSTGYIPTLLQTGVARLWE